jgi:pyruvate kinase
MINKKTKIVCTIGPASEKTTTLIQMIKSGMNVARLNFSHGTYADFKKIIRNIKTASKTTNVPIAIMQDLQGPKIRVGNIPTEGINLPDGAAVTLTTQDNSESSSKTAFIIPIQYKHLPKDVITGDRILLCDGMIELEVLKVKGSEIQCKTITGGLVEKHKGVNIPTASISANPITAKDRADLIFGLENDVDFVALSFVKNGANIAELRDLIRKYHGRAQIIAKIERHEAIKNMEEIIHEADGIMVARGDMGVEIAPENVPIVQKKLIKLANLHGKPVITATEMLQSMIINPRATRAEVSDIANAVMDHTDAIMLSNESAVGKFPVQACLTMAKIAASTEKELQKHYMLLPEKLFKNNQPVSYATCAAGAELATDINAKVIVALTGSGFTARHIAKHRTYIPIIAITDDIKVKKQLQLVWGVNKVIVRKIDPNCANDLIRNLLLKEKLVQRGDKVVIIINASKGEKLISTIII